MAYSHKINDLPAYWPSTAYNLAITHLVTTQCCFYSCFREGGSNAELNANF